MNPNLPTRLLRFFFHHLYHGVAFTYDLVAWTVSFGHWSEWTRTVLPYVSGPRLLELGHGPGRLHLALASERTAKHCPEPVEGSPDFAQRQETLESAVFGLDESSQMGRLARARLVRAGRPVRLTRGVAQSLPFPAESFDCILSTFPAEYIFDERTLAEARRALRGGGRFVVLPAGWPRNVLLQWLYRVTG
ncbi:MAG: methyltransferase domain-containing protein, partial [Chloroflexota bacterium]